MRRILALVSIFILLLFTGMPMFTSNLLCNETRVYADTPQISDNEKIRAAITVYLNSKGAYLSSQGLQMDAVMTAMQSLIDDFLIGGPIVAGEVYTQTKLLAEIGVNTSPLTVILRAGAVAFFNAFLQWLIDQGKITNTPNGSNGLYDGMVSGNSLYYIINQNINFNSYYYGYTVEPENMTAGSPIDGNSYSVLLNTFKAGSSNNHNYDFSLNENQTFDNVAFTVNYAADISVTHNMGMNRAWGDISNYNPILTWGMGNSSSDDKIAGHLAYCIYSERGKVIGNPARFIINRTNNTNVAAYGWVSYDANRNKYYVRILGSYNSSNNPGTAGSINFNKNNFDSSPTAEPGSNGLSYQPRQNGTGNTYNNYNDYYYDWHEGDTYIYYPSDPGNNEEPEEPGGTTPPWDGSQNPGIPSGTITPGSDGYYFNLPDIGLPDLDIDWSINGLKEKFPFSIPWDLMAFFAVLNAEPETPYIKADIPLGIWEWNIDWDLHAFDNVARILRNMELIGFCIGLILITRSIIKG